MTAFRPLLLETENGMFAVVGLVGIIDVLTEINPSSRLEALQIGFMRLVTEYTIEKHESPKGQEKLSMLLYGETCDRRSAGVL